MKHEEIIRIAREAGLGSALSHQGGSERIFIEGADWHDEAKQFAVLAAEAERGAILNVVRTYADARFSNWKKEPEHPDYQSSYMEGMVDASDDIIAHILKDAAIRARREQ